MSERRRWWSGKVRELQSSGLGQAEYCRRREQRASAGWLNARGRYRRPTGIAEKFSERGTRS